MVKFHRDEDDHEEPTRKSQAGGSIVLVAVLAAGGFVVLLCAGLVAVGFYTSRTAVREAEMAQVEVAERTVQIEAEQNAEEVRDFREKVKHYLTEARAGAKLMTGAPSAEDAKKTASHISDLQADLPDVPPEIDPTGKVAGKLKGIRVTFASAAENVRLRAGFAEVGDEKRAAEAAEKLVKTVADVNAAADEIDVMVGIRTKP